MARSRDSNSIFILVVVALLIIFCTNAMAASIATFFFDTSAPSDLSFSLPEIMRSSSVVLQINTNVAASCKYSLNKGTSYDNMEGTFDYSFDILHKKTFTGLEDGVYKYFVRCKVGGNESKELETKFSVSIPINAKISINEGEIIRAGRTEIKLITSKIASQTPSLTYSFDGVGYNPIPLTGAGTSWTGYLIIGKDAGEKVGSFKFQGRDLEGGLGTEINSGGVFFVDTLKPETIKDFDVLGYNNRIQLEWSFDDEEEVLEYKIYRSTEPNVDFSDFYKSVKDTESYSDSTVEKGKTYYYKISAVDEADNEGDLSHEAYATVLIDDNEKETSTGLELRYHGLVDSFLTEIDFILNDASNARSAFESRGGKETQLFNDLRLSREAEGANSELNSLKREVENYKQQSLSKADLDKKLNTAQLKLITIKKKIPESLIVSSEKSIMQEISEQNLRQIFLELDANDEKIDVKIERSLQVMNENNFKVKTEGYNLEIVYLDGTRKKVALVKEEVDFEESEIEGMKIVEYIPKNIAESVSEINVKNVDYDVLKDDPILSFSRDTREISYTIGESINLDDLKNVKTIILVEMVETEVEKSAITGYFSLVSLEELREYSGLIFGVFAIAGLFVYLIFTKKDFQSSEKMLNIRNLIGNANKSISEGRFQDAKNIYNQLSSEYKALGKKEKKSFYGELKEIYKKMEGI